MLVFVTSCSSDLQRDASLDLPLDSVPLIKAFDVNTLVSDSGIMRFRVIAKSWYVYDKREEPCWDFPEGIHFDQFDKDLTISARVDADTAIYYNELEKWVLSGNVKAINLEGESFESQKLYIEQKKDRIFTDQYMKITQKERIIEGLGFESNQTLTRYTVLNPKGIIPLDRDDSLKDSTAIQ